MAGTPGRMLRKVQVARSPANSSMLSKTVPGRTSPGRVGLRRHSTVERKSEAFVAATASSEAVYVPGGTLMVVMEPSPADGRTTSPLTSRSKTLGSSAGSITFSSVNRAGNQLPKSRPRAFGTSSTSSGPHAHGNRPAGALPVPPGVLLLGWEQTQSVATGCVRLRRANVVSRSRYSPSGGRMSYSTHWPSLSLSVRGSSRSSRPSSS